MVTDTTEKGLEALITNSLTTTGGSPATRRTTNAPTAST